MHYAGNQGLATKLSVLCPLISEHKSLTLALLHSSVGQPDDLDAEMEKVEVIMEVRRWAWR